ncbi:hypothetical protein GGR54DRAFT_207565 [Hypoxylon sp. NC1633]|nr:hypothetical protein GGR54DRAFT_207565 [Hypoxylon sp. NC1633]
MDRTSISPVVQQANRQHTAARLKQTMDRPESITPPDMSTRTSFSSVRENDSDLAQTFTSTKVSSYSKPEEEAVDDLPSPSEMATQTQTQFIPPVTNPHSRLHGCWFPAIAAEGFQGWKQIGVRGRQASRSYGDLQALKIVWSTPAAPIKKKDPERPAPGQSSIEKLPTEILGQIIDHLVLDVPPNGVSARNVDLMSLLLTSRTLHSETLNALYKNITIPHSRIFRKFLSHVAQNKELGTIVRRLDFSHFNPTTLFSTASERATTRNLTPETLLQCLELTPFLLEFLGQEYIEDEVDAKVLRKLFFGLDRLQAVDFCGFSSTEFKNAFQSILLSDWPETLSISRLSLHKCINLPPSVIETLLPRLGNLTHLDLAGTRVTDAAIHSIPHNAMITHLNLARCRFLTADGVIDFLANHPSVKGLVFLSLGVDARSHQLFDEDDLNKLIPVLPSSLRSLSLKGSKMAPSHIDLLRPLTKHLEELALGRRLKIVDIDRLFVPDESTADGDDVGMSLEWTPHSLRYLDLSDYTATELDLLALFGRATSLMKSYSAPLEVIEVNEGLFLRLAHSPVVRQLGWTITENQNRAWLVRVHDHVNSNSEDGGSGGRDSGLRSWKMGASFWGMRKVPVACAEVGGMYGSYMYRRRL